MFDFLSEITSFVSSLREGVTKEEVKERCIKEFNLVRDRSIFYCDDFAIRFSSSKSGGFSNTVTSISNVHKYDEKPLLSCLVTPNTVTLSLMNSTFIKKVSHSSRDLRVNNLRGSINGSDIMKAYNELENRSENLLSLFLSHQEFTFGENLERIVEATNNIVGSKTKIVISDTMRKNILDAPARTSSFLKGAEYSVLHKNLDERVKQHESEIRIASLMPNVKIRGQLIEYLITGETSEIKNEVIRFLKKEVNNPPYVPLENALGDYRFDFENYKTETDIKTKVLYLSSNPKAYNIDKLLSFLSEAKSVFLLYFVGVDKSGEIKLVLTSPFETSIVETTSLLHHWAGRNSRGVTQFNGEIIKEVIRKRSLLIDESISMKFLEVLMNSNHDAG